MSNQGKLTGIPLYSLMAGMLLFGTCNTIFMKLQDSVKIDGVFFTHAFFQCAVMFVGELMCLVFYGGKLLYQRKYQSQQYLPSSPGAM